MTLVNEQKTAEVMKWNSTVNLSMEFISRLVVSSSNQVESGDFNDIKKMMLVK